MSGAEEIGHSSAHSNTPSPQPHTKYKHKTPSEYKNLYVPIQTQNVMIDAVVNTAAQVSVISENLYKRLHPNPKIKGHVLLKGISGTNIDS